MLLELAISNSKIQMKHLAKKQRPVATLYLPFHCLQQKK